jgi:hypothetical protein
LLLNYKLFIYRHEGLMFVWNLVLHPSLSSLLKHN